MERFELERVLAVLKLNGNQICQKYEDGRVVLVQYQVSDLVIENIYNYTNIYYLPKFFMDNKYSKQILVDNTTIISKPTENNISASVNTKEQLLDILIHYEELKQREARCSFINCDSFIKDNDKDTLLGKINHQLLVCADLSIRREDWILNRKITEYNHLFEEFDLVINPFFDQNKQPTLYLPSQYQTFHIDVTEQGNVAYLITDELNKIEVHFERRIRTFQENAVMSMTLSYMDEEEKVVITHIIADDDNRGKFDLEISDGQCYREFSYFPNKRLITYENDVVFTEQLSLKEDELLQRKIMGGIALANNLTKFMHVTKNSKQLTK